MDDKTLLSLINKEFETLRDSKDASNTVARKIYPLLPLNPEDTIKLFHSIVSKGEWRLFYLVTLWIKRKELYLLDDFIYYQEWLFHYIDTWGSCDVFCYRVLNPMIVRYPTLYRNLLEWTESTRIYVRRAAAVSFLESGKSFKVRSPISQVLSIVERLKFDDELHVQKGIGWLLKYTYLTYPEEVHSYLFENVSTLSRVTYRYALEKAPKSIRDELMAL